MASVLLGPLVPTTISRVLTSSRLRIGEVCQATQTLVSLLALPIQLTLSASKRLSTPISGSKASARWAVAMAVPSRGATL